MGKSAFKLLIYGLVLVILFLGLLNIISELTRKVYLLELLGLFFLLLLALLAFFGYKAWGERVLFFVFVFYALNLVLIWYLRGSLYLVLLFLALLGGLISFPSKGSRAGVSKKPVVPSKREPVEPHSQVFEVPVAEGEKARVDTDVRVEKISSKPVAVDKSAPFPAVKPTVKYSPGKYVASKFSNNYHEPKCDWAKKIHKERQLWFGTKEEAWEKGYKAHGCVQ